MILVKSDQVPLEPGGKQRTRPWGATAVRPTPYYQGGRNI